jgi:hypothetical protein
LVELAFSGIQDILRRHQGSAILCAKLSSAFTYLCSQRIALSEALASALRFVEASGGDEHVPTVMSLTVPPRPHTHALVDRLIFLLSLSLSYLVDCFFFFSSFTLG